MGTGWRRAFCTTIPRDREPHFVDKHAQDSQQVNNNGGQQIPTPKSCAKLGFLSSSNPSTPRLRCKTNNTASSNDISSLISPKLHCRTTPKSNTKSPKTFLGPNPSSPRSPFSILKNTLRLSKHNCGVCTQSVKSGQGMAIYKAECSHTFHFPCIASHVKKQSNLVCPVCNSTWKDVPLLAIHRLQQQEDQKTPKPEEVESYPNTPIKKQEKSLPNVKTYYKPEQCDYKGYNDDESLFTPTAGAKFVSIPEANEDQEDNEEEVEEFQGFFVNPISSDEAFANQRDNRSVEVSLMPEAAIVSVGRTHETYAVVLKIKAPPPPPSPPAGNSNSGSGHFLDPARRAPIDLVTVLDVSGSMSGAKIQMLKRAMRLVISSLGSVDRLSIVAFSATPKRLLPLRRMTPQGQRSARRIIDRLVCSQGTCVGEALRKAGKVLEDRRERNPVASIMLLSDGQDEKIQGSNTHNRRSSESTHVSSTRFGHIEIPVHSSGFGKKGGFSHEPAEEDAFSKCVGGLLSVVVQDLKIQLDFSSGSDPAEVAAVYSYNGRPAVLGSTCVRLGDLYAEEERELLLEVKIPTMTNGSHHVLSVRCCYKDPATQEAIYGREHSLLVPRPQAIRSSIPKIERLRNLFITTRAIAESRRLIEHNELSSAMHLLSSARALLIQSGSAFVDEYVRGLEAELTEVQWRKQYQQQIEQQKMIQRQRMNEREMNLFLDENGEPLTPTSAWRAAEKLAKVAMMKKSMNRVSDLHGFENARF
ncbi:E3 ubiquitin-protein ligase WAV3 [Solanum stenotomum]|uniref:E3 ubiquitin-protein ligase WAV3 n=1 Tax=Solanum stenotomum TaxID=172797 RepID=UPI0020D09A8C|nr:E3 ubiquitin-protein ligase WAV3 [Solanum stenotomum]